MIPKVIHFIWLGNNPIDKRSQMCINSAKRNLNNYKINIWTEKNLNLQILCSRNKFFNECIKNKLWAFASDYLRLYILSKYGGIYLDTDVEVIKKFDSLLNNKCFLGKEKELNGKEYIGTGIIGAEKNSKVISKLLSFYDEKIWKVDYYNNPIIFSNVLSENNFKNDVKVYPTNYFCPYVPFSKKLFVNVTSSTYTIHWYSANWGMSRKGYVFLNTKQYKNGIKICQVIRKNIGYFRIKLKNKKESMY